MSTTEVIVDMTISANVPVGYDEHDLADAVRFHLGLSSLDAIEADISSVRIRGAREKS